MTFFSVDVETSSTVPCLGHLLTVGIVPVVHDGESWALDPRQLYIRIDCGDHFAEHEHYSSMAWWREQADEVRAEAYEDRSLVRHTSKVAAMMIAEFVIEIEPLWEQRFFAANPVSFDKPWIDELLAVRRMPPLFHYRSLCLRSMRFGMDPSRGFGSSRETHEPKIPHHALWDAHAQALDLIDMLS